jgi:hypothetical protein
MLQESDGLLIFLCLPIYMVTLYCFVAVGVFKLVKICQDGNFISFYNSIKHMFRSVGRQINGAGLCY